MQLRERHQPDRHGPARGDVAGVVDHGVLRGAGRAGLVERVVDAQLEGVGARGPGALDQQVAQPGACGDAVQVVAVGVRGHFALGRGRIELGLVVVDDVGACAALVERQRRVHGLPAGRDRRRRRPASRRSPCTRAPRSARRTRGCPRGITAGHSDVVLAGEVIQPHAAQVPALLQAREDLQQRVVPTAAAPEGGDHERQAQALAVGHRRHRIEQRRGALAPEARDVLVVVVVRFGGMRGRRHRRDARRGIGRELRGRVRRGGQAGAADSPAPLAALPPSGPPSRPSSERRPRHGRRAGARRASRARRNTRRPLVVHVLSAPPGRALRTAAEALRLAPPTAAPRQPGAHPDARRRARRRARRGRCSRAGRGTRRSSGA